VKGEVAIRRRGWKINAPRKRARPSPLANHKWRGESASRRSPCISFPHRRGRIMDGKSRGIEPEKECTGNVQKKKSRY